MKKVSLIALAIATVGSINPVLSSSHYTEQLAEMKPFRMSTQGIYPTVDSTFNTYGFSSKEPHHTWTEGKYAHIDVPAIFAGQKVTGVSFPFVKGNTWPGKTQTANVSVVDLNNHHQPKWQPASCGTYNFAHGESKNIDIDFRKYALNNIARIQFDLPDASGCPATNDKRNMALMFSGMQVNLEPIAQSTYSMPNYGMHPQPTVFYPQYGNYYQPNQYMGPSSSSGHSYQQPQNWNYQPHQYGKPSSSSGHSYQQPQNWNYQPHQYGNPSSSSGYSYQQPQFGGNQASAQWINEPGVRPSAPTMTGMPSSVVIPGNPNQGGSAEDRIAQLAPQLIQALNNLNLNLNLLNRMNQNNDDSDND